MPDKIPFTAFALAMIAGSMLAGCATVSRAQPASADFSGTWSVRWCDRSNPKLECGGFNLDLIQDGERLCGDFGGALVNLRQVDEGRVTGSVVGHTAIIAAASQRSESVVLVRAELSGDALRWKQVDTVVEGNGDISVIATDEKLIRERAPRQAKDATTKPRRTCSSASE